MAFEVYRVNRRFVWDGWQFAPEAGAHGQRFETLPEPRKSAKVAVASYPKDNADFHKQQGCWDERGCNPEFYAGNIWIVEENHPRKAALLARNKATYDSGLPRVDDLLKDAKYKRLLSPPKLLAKV
jgi:hypothetical protein